MNSKSAITTIIVAIIIGAASFWGGMTYQKNKSNLRTFQRGEGGVTRQEGNMPGGQQRRQAGPNAGQDFVGGEITAKDDKSITVKIPDRSSKIIYFSHSTTIGKTENGSASDLSIGQQVMINGKGSNDGSVAATNIQ